MFCLLSLAREGFRHELEKLSDGNCLMLIGHAARMERIIDFRASKVSAERQVSNCGGSKITEMILVHVHVQVDTDPIEREVLIAKDMD